MTDTKRERQRAVAEYLHNEVWDQTADEAADTILELIAEVEDACEAGAMERMKRQEAESRLEQGRALLAAMADQPLQSEMVDDLEDLRDGDYEDAYDTFVTKCRELRGLMFPVVVEEQRPYFSTLKGRIDAATESREQRPDWLKSGYRSGSVSDPAVQERGPKLVNPVPNPRYDDVYAEGVRQMNEDATEYLYFSEREVARLQTADIASFAFPHGSRERYTDAGWEKMKAAGIAVEKQLP
jgi:hypothetical protein